jgi:hypothetical protein
MAARKPLVIVSGRIQQLQSGDTLDAVASEKDVVSMVADATLIAGNAVYASAAGHCDKARANAVGTSRVVGLATAAITSGASGSIQTNGVVSLSTGEWDALTGGSGGLTYNTVYYLSAATAGLLTSTAPSTTGQTVVQLGIGLSTTELYLDPQPEVLL